MLEGNWRTSVLVIELPVMTVSIITSSKWQPYNISILYSTESQTFNPPLTTLLYFCFLSRIRTHTSQSSLLLCWIENDTVYKNIQWNLTPKFSDTLWHLTKNDGPKVFLLTKIKPEYSNILYNPTHFPGHLVCRIRQVPPYICIHLSLWACCDLGNILTFNPCKSACDPAATWETNTPIPCSNPRKTQLLNL